MSLTKTGRVAVVEQHGGSVHVNVYKDRLSMVLDEIDCGSLSGLGSGHGSDAHLAALRAVHDRASEIIRAIEAARAEERAP